MNIQELLAGARTLAGFLPPPAGAFATVVLGIADALAEAGDWHEEARLVHDVVASYRRSDDAGKAAMRARWQEHAAEALRRAAEPYGE